jgi:glycosyltransferase involved in cell wall biosynthesis
MPAQEVKHVSSDAGEAPGVISSKTADVRVLHLNAGNLYGGVETVLVTLARLRHLCPAMEPHFGLCYEGRLSRELAAAGVPVHLLGPVRLSRPWSVWRARRLLRELVRKLHFDLVVCHMPWSLAVFGPALKATGQRLGFWAHAFHNGSGWLERLARLAEPDVAIANSRFTKAGFANIFPRVPAAIIYPPVALIPKLTTDASRSVLRKQLGAEADTVVIIQVSRIERCKGHLVHLQALAKLSHLATPWVCWIVGGAQRAEEEEYLSQLRRSASLLELTERVRFLGQRSDVADLLGAADIFCQPNETPDSFGITFIEALSASRPVVTSALGGALEIIDDSCGLLVNPGDAPGLAAALGRLIEHPQLRSALGYNGAAHAFELCDPNHQMKLLYELSRGGNPGPPHS